MNQPPFTPCIPSLIDRLVREFGDAEAVVDTRKRLTYRELERESALVARGLLAAGVSKATRVGLLMPNAADWAVAFLAITRIGAIAVPLSTLFQAPELAWVVRHADLHTLILADRYRRHDYLARMEEAFPGLIRCSAERILTPEAPYLRQVFVWGQDTRGWSRPWEALAAGADAIGPDILAAAEAQVTPADLLFLIYTSGSTADPKGVAHTHGAVVRHTWQITQDYWLPKRGDRVVSLRPYFWISGVSATLLYGLQAGACIVTPASEAPADMLAAIKAEKATAVTGTAALFASIAADPLVIDSGYTVKRVTTDTAAVARREAPEAPYRFVSDALEARLPAAGPRIPHGRMASTFGMTETLAGHTSLPALKLVPEGKEGAAGYALPGVTLKIVDPATGETLPAGEVGELYVRGYSLMAGLYKRERCDTFDPDGFYPTGDLCLLDEDGLLTFRGRSGEMLKVHGANVAPLEVERAICELPGVQEAAVIGLCEGRDTTVMAVVAPLAGAILDEQALLDALRRRLSSFKTPKRIFFMDAESLPRTATGKIRKRDLAAMLPPAPDRTESQCSFT